MLTRLPDSTRARLKKVIDNRLVYYHVDDDPSSVMLTFDDGPHPELTPRVLDLLDEHDAKAVFFPIGERAERAPELLEEIHRRGHAIGNHTYSHMNDHRGGSYSLREYVADIKRGQDVVRSITGVETHLFRPPRGELNWKTLSATLWSGHRIVHWSLEGGEWGRRENESGPAITRFVAEHLKPRDIVLLHDDNPKTLDVLTGILPLANERRLDFRPTSLATRPR